MTINIRLHLGKCEGDVVYWSRLNRSVVVGLHYIRGAAVVRRVDSLDAARVAVADYLQDMKEKRPNTPRFWAIGMDGALVDSGCDEVASA